MSANKKGVVKLDGREYKTVAARVAEFREQCPFTDGWGIVTYLVECSDQVICRACIIDPTGREVATGYAQETWDSGGFNDTSAVEVAETSAIGRALAAAGFVGTELQYCSADEVARAKEVRAAGKTNKPKARKSRTPASAAGGDSPPSDTMEGLVEELHAISNVDDAEVLEAKCNHIADRFRALRRANPADGSPACKKVVELLVEYKRLLDDRNAADDE